MLNQLPSLSFLVYARMYVKKNIFSRNISICTVTEVPFVDNDETYFFFISFLIENSEDNRGGPKVNQDNKHFRLSGHISFSDNRQSDTLNLGIPTLISKAFHYFSIVLPVFQTHFFLSIF